MKIFIYFPLVVICLFSSSCSTVEKNRFYRVEEKNSVKATCDKYSRYETVEMDLLDAKVVLLSVVNNGQGFVGPLFIPFFPTLGGTTKDGSIQLDIYANTNPVSVDFKNAHIKVNSSTIYPSRITEVDAKSFRNVEVKLIAKSEIIKIEPKSEKSIVLSFDSLVTYERIELHLPELKIGDKTFNRTISYNRQEKWDYNPIVFQEMGISQRYTACKKD